MRTEDEISERIRLTIIEQINLINQKEPENFIPAFIDILTNRITEITLDEIMIRRRFYK